MIDFLPSAADTFGGFGIQAEGAMKEAAKNSALLRGSDAISSAHMRQNLQLAVLRGVARQLLRRITHHDLEDDDLDTCSNCSG